VIKTAVIGASGYIGRHLWRSYRSRFPDCVGTNFSRSNPDLHHFDIRRPDLAALQLTETGHEAVLIASARPLVGWCEDNKEEARAVNVEGTLELVRQIGELGLKVIFLSSDYVFDGNAGPYADTARTAPGTEYGRNKAEVEAALPALVEDYMILRLSKIYDTVKGGGTLLDEMATLLAAGKPVRAAMNQTFCPTHISDVVDVIHALQEQRARGLFNLCNPQGFSRHELAVMLAGEMKVDPALVEAIDLHSLPSMATRPLDTRMIPSQMVLAVKPEFLPLNAHAAELARAWQRP
jgi:dTDP-4-dehydrorhamnose reductase